MQITTRNDFGKLAQTYNKLGAGAEIGVERGNFSAHILKDFTGRMTCVDMWANDAIYRQAQKNLDMPRCTMVKKESVKAAEMLPDGSLDFVYIDADHDYTNCKADIYAWFPKVRHGGIVAGHDYLNWTRDQGAGCDFGVKAAVDEFCLKRGYTLYVTTDDYWQGDPYQTWYFIKDIPKVIYYTWVSPDPLPNRFKKYIDGWRILMPDYQVRQISLENIIQTPFVKEAIRRKKYSVAGHYGRCQELYDNGGIYFDIDVEAVRRFDNMLSTRHEFIVGCETAQRVNNAVIISRPGHGFIKSCLEYMDVFDFNNPGKLGIEIETGPEMFTRIAKLFGWEENIATQFLPFGTVICSPHVFYPYYFDQPYRPGCVSSETYAVHHWAKTW